MNFVEIKCYPIAKTSTNKAKIREWLKDLGVSDKFVFDEEVTDSESLIGLAAKRCYKSFEPGLNPNVTKVRTDWADYLTNILASGHGSVLEHATWTWAIENCSRVFTAEMNRHRAGVAISEASMRYIRIDDKGIPITLTPMLKDIILKASFGPLSESAEFLREFKDAIKNLEAAYLWLTKLWIKDSMPFHEKKVATSLLRRILPMGIATGAVYTLNIRALRHILALRTSSGAEEEIRFICGFMAKTMVEEECKLFGDFEEVDGCWVPKYPKV